MSNPRTLELPALKTRCLGRPTYHYESVTSTQDLLKKMLPDAPSEGTTILADRMTAGRGRMGRSWFTPETPQICFSVLLHPKIAPAKLPLLNIAAGIAVCEALEDCGNLPAHLKWPNDVFLAEKKVGGILSELSSIDASPRALRLILGIGINTSGSLDKFPAELRNTATTVEASIGFVDRFILYCCIQEALENWYDVLSREGPKPLQEEFTRRWIYRNQEVEISQGSKTATGTAEGIDRDGALLLQDSKGEIHRIVAGDLTLRSKVATPAQD